MFEQFVLQLVNILACMVMFQFLAVIAILMPARGMWARRLLIIALTVALGCQVTASLAAIASQPGRDLGFVVSLITNAYTVRELFAEPAWYAVLMDAAFATALLLWRKQAMSFVRCNFKAAPPQQHPMRRATDYAH
jgi:hypothetical protein